MGDFNINLLRCESCNHAHNFPLSLQSFYFIPISINLQLKHAKIIPVYKSDDPTDPGNYRPISLLSIFNHVFEKLMYKSCFI